MTYKNPIPELKEQPNLSFATETQTDYTQLNEVYFAFIDVLGFKNTFNDIKISKDEEIADKYREVFNYYFELMNAAKFIEKGKDTGCYAGQTSDSLYFYTDRTDYLMEFLKIFSHFNLYAMSKNVFFRGGVSKGNLYKREKFQFYGDSVIGAFLLESNISKNPIVTIDEKTHNDMTNLPEYNELVEDSHGRHIIKPFYYLDKKICLEIDEKFLIKEINNKDIKKNISKNMNVFEFDEKNYNKYAFLHKQISKNSTTKE